MIAVREATAADRHFIVSSWTQSYRTAFTAGLIQAEDWYPIMDAQVEKVLARPDVRTMVAHDPNETDGIADLLGFLTADVAEIPPLVYYCYTKVSYRRAGRGRIWDGPGVTRALFDAFGIDPERPFNYVCSTPMARTLARKIPMAKWQPLLGRFPKAERRNRR
ncbi:MAG TPA: hypothetical protein VGM39_08665 [Kofleriaceae bacterium]|jgi:hypothetical protein